MGSGLGSGGLSSLPLTGPHIGPLVGAGIFLVGAGMLAMVLTQSRRRRISNR
jgi:hypothetical protein